MLIKWPDYQYQISEVIVELRTPAMPHGFLSLMTDALVGHQ
jgi:hypothetical protein